ncbi:alcohol dehydrogenase catalytic domain-containing protein [Microbacterium sp.]|uniref:alcohol dehydrogenase catalytic domain-containing protein n=1 Tax=Microbacterium sp. TaxID=51671 RepID=UPI0039E6393C
MLASQVIDKNGELGVYELPDPVAGPGEAVVAVEAAGLAPGAFSLLRMGAVPILPTTFGHEIAGTVVSVGDEARTDLVGRRVRVHPLLSCGVCDYCTTDREMMCAQNAMIGHAVFGPEAMPRYSRYHDGGLAQQVLVPVDNLDLLPDKVDAELGAKAHDFANAVRALKLAETGPQAVIIVTAATGAMGVATIAIAREFGVRQIIAVGRDADRLAQVVDLDPDLVTPLVLGDDDTAQSVAGRIRAIAPAGAHAAIDYLPGGKGTSFIFGGLRTGSRIVHMGVNPEPFVIPPAAFSIHCISFIGTRNGTRKDAHDALRLLAADPDRYRRLITHRLALDEAHLARDNFSSRAEPMWMAVVNPGRLAGTVKADENRGDAS